MSSDEIRCALCEEPLTAQGVRCSECQAAHHPKCFSSRGPACAGCGSVHEPVAFEITREAWTPPARGITTRTRLVLGSGVLALGLAIAGWYGISTPGKPAGAREPFSGCWSLTEREPIAIASGTDKWTELALPEGGSFGDLVFAVSVSGKACREKLPRIRVEVSHTPGVWKSAGKVTPLPSCTTVHRVTPKKPFVGARVSVSPAGASVAIRGGFALAHAAPAMRVTDLLRTVSVTSVHDKEVGLARGERRATVSRAFLDPTRRYVHGSVLDEESGVIGRIGIDARVGLERPGIVRLPEGMIEHGRRALASLAGSGCEGFLERGGMWHLLRRWRSATVSDWVCHPDGRRAYALMDDGRVALVHGSGSSAVSGVRWFEGVDALAEARENPDAHVVSVIAPRFAAALGMRPPLAEGATYVLDASYQLALANGKSWRANVAEKWGDELITYELGPYGQTAKLPAAWFPVLPQPSMTFQILPDSHTLYPAKVRPAPAARGGGAAPLGQIVDGVPTFRLSRWGMTEAEVRASEGSLFLSAATAPDGSRQLIYRGTGPGQRPFKIMYVFLRNSLFAGNLYLEEQLAPDAAQREAAYFRELLTSAHGPPSSSVGGEPAHDHWNANGIQMAVWLFQSRHIQVEMTNPALLRKLRGR